MVPLMDISMNCEKEQFCFNLVFMFTSTGSVPEKAVAVALAYKLLKSRGKYAKPEVDPPVFTSPTLTHPSFLHCLLFIDSRIKKVFISLQWLLETGMLLFRADYQPCNKYVHQQQRSRMVVLLQDNLHYSYGNAGDKEWDWELVGLFIPTEYCLCPSVGSPTICGLNKHS